MCVILLIRRIDIRARIYTWLFATSVVRSKFKHKFKFPSFLSLKLHTNIIFAYMCAQIVKKKERWKKEKAQLSGNSGSQLRRSSAEQSAFLCGLVLEFREFPRALDRFPPPTAQESLCNSGSQLRRKQLCSCAHKLYAAGPSKAGTTTTTHGRSKAGGWRKASQRDPCT